MQKFFPGLEAMKDFFFIVGINFSPLNSVCMICFLKSPIPPESEIVGPQKVYYRNTIEDFADFIYLLTQNVNLLTEVPVPYYTLKLQLWAVI